MPAIGNYHSRSSLTCSPHERVMKTCSFLAPAPDLRRSRLSRPAEFSRIPPFLRPACRMVTGRRQKPRRDFDVQGISSLDAGSAAPDLANDPSARRLRRPSGVTSRRMSDRRAGVVPVVRNIGRKLAGPHRDARGPSEAPRTEQSRPAPPQLVSSPPRDDCAG